MQTQKSQQADPSNSKRQARMWADFVNIEKRMGREIPFILGQAPKSGPAIFDSCLGCGATSIGLKLKKVKDVLSNEIDQDMLDAARVEAGKRRVGLFIISEDWRELPLEMHGMFDMVTCLGNSLTLIFDREERLKVLRNFASLLNHNGVLIIDERNYPRILEGRFSQSGEYVYCGVDKVACRPVHISDGLVVMEYKHLQTGDGAYLEMYPFRRGELLGHLKEAGFSDIEAFGDYSKVFNLNTAEFFTYVARKEG